MAKINEWLEKEKLTLLEGWARDGLTYEQIAKNMGIGLTTLKEWRQKEPTISTTLKKGREVADYEVENALFKRALGYKYDEITYENGIMVKKVTKEVAPDTTAQIFWLKNRKSDKWRDKIEVNKQESAINNQILNIANLLNNPKDNRSDKDVQ